MKPDVAATAARTVVSIALLALFLWIATLHWYCVWLGWVRRVKAPSMVPFVGGVLGAVGVLLFPYLPPARWIWIPLVVDPGCALMVPVLIWAVVRQLYPRLPSFKVASFCSDGNSGEHVTLTTYRSGLCDLQLKRDERWQKEHPPAGEPVCVRMGREGSWTRGGDTLTLDLGDSKISYTITSEQQTIRLHWSADSDHSEFDQSELVQTDGEPL